MPRALLTSLGVRLCRPSPRNSDPAGGPTPVDPADNLGSMLLDAERAKEALQGQLADSKAEIVQLQKQLMKAMKATAFG